MSGVAALLRPPTHGLRLWYAVLSGIALWMAHVLIVTSLARIRCSEGWVDWILHGSTVVLGIGTLVGMVWSWQLWRQHADAVEDAPDATSRWMFLGLFGFLTQAISLLVIVWEGLYVPFLRSCGA